MVSASNPTIHTRSYAVCFLYLLADGVGLRTKPGSKCGSDQKGRLMQQVPL
jgi:hypothetical protein